MLLLLILGDFLHRQPCYLWTKTVLFLPSQSGYLLFLFLVLLHSLRTFGITLNTSGEGGYACFVIGRKASTFSPLSDVSCRVFVHVLYQFECLFYVYWYDHMIFLLVMIVLIDFSNVEPAFHTGIHSSWSWFISHFMCVDVFSLSVMSDSLWPHGL